MFNQDENGTKASNCVSCITRITRADGVIIATPEHNHTISASLNLYLNGFHTRFIHLKTNLLRIVGASYYDQGTSRAQVHLRKILDAPGVNAYTLPGK